MRRFKITIQYDGSSFSGWQLQKNLRTVQGEVEDALKIISGSKFRIPVHGSGRTDAGVHAYGQVAHFDIDTKLDPIKLCDAINANTTKDCKIMSALEVNSKFEGMIKALSYGAPPHGGMAPGIDRIVMLLAGKDNIREITMFPMNQKAEDLLMGAPSKPSELQLKELNIKVLEKKK